MINIEKLRKRLFYRVNITLEIQTIKELLNRLEATKKERDDLRAENAALVDDMNLLRVNNTALRAKIEAMEKQEPVGWLLDGDFYEVRQMSLYKDNEPLPGQTPLYALPGAKGE